MEKNTYICYAMLICSVVSDSLQPHGLWPTRLLCPRDPPGKNTRVSCHFLFQGIFPTQGSNPGLPHCSWTLYCLSHQGSLVYVYVYIHMCVCVGVCVCLQVNGWPVGRSSWCGGGGETQGQLPGSPKTLFATRSIVNSHPRKFANITAFSVSCHQCYQNLWGHCPYWGMCSEFTVVLLFWVLPSRRPSTCDESLL